jgi:hypothetical protein
LVYITCCAAAREASAPSAMGEVIREMLTDMSTARMRDISEAVVHATTEEEYAEWRRRQGRRVISANGRYWEETFRGFYEPIHWMARLNAHEARRPTRWCIGFRARLHEDAGSLANAVMPANLLDDLQNYSIDTLPAKRRSDLRKCRKLVSIGQLTDAEILKEQGYEVVASAAQRTGYGRIPERQEYIKRVDRLVQDPRLVVIAGLVDGRLGGYVVGFAVDDAAYFLAVHIASQHLHTAIGTGLAFDFARVWQRCPGIRYVVYGLHSAEDPNLNVFKEGMGFPVVGLRSRVWMGPGLRSLIRWGRPGFYYRLTGIGADQLAKAPQPAIPTDRGTRKPVTTWVGSGALTSGT